MKKLMRFFLYCIIFFTALVIFFPKTNIYYLLEDELKSQQVIINSEIVNDTLFSLQLKEAEIYFNNIESAFVEELSITVLGLYNSISARDIRVSKAFESFVPTHIENAAITYALYNPVAVSISSQGDFGDLQGAFSLIEMKLTLIMKPSELMRQKYKKLLRMMKKDENGEYRYELGI